MNSTTTIRRRPRLQMPVIRGVIERRMLVNFRCPPTMLARILPAPFRPKIIRGWGMAGICLIRLSAIRPAHIPACLGIRSENAAHRIAVEWDEAGKLREGVFIPRRDTNSWLNQLAGGTVFPGAHHAADFRVWEAGERFKLEMRSRDGNAVLRIHARITDELPPQTIFRTLAEASTFFRNGALGWSTRPQDKSFDGLELDCPLWQMAPLAMDHLESSYFQNTDLFPPDAAEFDSALLMRDLPHEWHACGTLTANATEAK